MKELSKKKIINYCTIFFIVFLVMVSSVSSFSNWRFGAGSFRAIIIENLMFLKPVLSNLVLLLFGSYIFTRKKSRLFKFWKQIVFYSIFFMLLSFALVITRYSWWLFIQGLFPILLQNNQFAGALIGILISAPILKNSSNRRALLVFIIIGLLSWSILPTIIWTTHLVTPLQQEPNGIIWGVVITLILKYLSDINWNKKFVTYSGLITIGIGEALLVIFNKINFKTPFLWTGFQLIKHNIFLSTNIFALILSIIIFLLIQNYFYFRGKKLEFLVGATLVSNHFLFAKPMWNDIFGSSNWINNRGFVMISFIALSAILVTAITIVFEQLRQIVDQQISTGEVKWPTAILVSFCISLLGYITLLLTNSMMDTRLLVRDLNGKSGLMFINIILLFSFILIIYVILNRWIVASVISFVLIVSFAFGNYQKILARNEPITPIDITSNIKNARAILDLVNIWMVVGLLIVFVVLIGISIYFERKLKMRRIFSWPEKTVVLVIMGSLLAVFIIKLPNVPSSSVTWKAKDKTMFNTKLVQQLNYRYHPESVWFDFKTNGAVLSFMSRIRIPIMDKPSMYSEKSIKGIEKQYSSIATNINQQRKTNIDKDVVIYILSESFSNPNRVPNVKTNTDPIPYTNNLMRNTTSGIMNSYGYGGGTADMEFESLSGMSLNNFAPALSTPYVELMPKVKYMPSVLDLFTTKTAIHPYQPALYNRVSVFKQFGFQKFYNTVGPQRVKYTEKLKGSKYISDKSAYKQAISALQENKSGQFIQLSTMQNHMPYQRNEYPVNYPIKAAQLTSASRARLETYTEGIHQSDKSLQTLIDAVDKDKRNVSIVFYGDHLPGLYEWSKNNDSNMNKYDSELHQTDYFIYSNRDGKKLEKKVVAPYMFTPMMLKQNNAKVSPYYALLTRCMEELPAGERGKYMLSNGKQVKESHLSRKQKELLEQYRLVQYDITAGKHYLSKKSPFFEINK